MILPWGKGRDYGRSGIKWMDRLAKIVGWSSTKTGVSDLPKSERKICDDFDDKAKDIFEDLFGSPSDRISSEELLEYLKKT